MMRTARQAAMVFRVRDNNRLVCACTKSKMRFSQASASSAIAQRRGASVGIPVTGPCR